MLIRDRNIAWVELDPFREIADVDDSNNRWPPQIETQLVRVTTYPERGNPLRTHLKEQARVEGRASIEGFASELFSAWSAAQEAGALTPQEVGDELLALSSLLAARDPWDRPFVIELSDDQESYAELAEGELEADAIAIAVIRSSGEDGEPDTPDDLRWRVMADGSVSP